MTGPGGRSDSGVGPGGRSDSGVGPGGRSDSGVGSVGAVVVSYNSAAYLVDCLLSLRSEGVAEVVVVDNASSDGSVGVARSAGAGVTVMETGTNLGFGAGANRGVAATKSDYVLILNPDTVVEPGMVKALSEALDRDDGLALVGPRIENLDGTLYPSVRRFPNLVVAFGHAFVGLVWPANPFTRRYRMLDWDHDRPAADVDWVGGACILVRRSAFDLVAGFDEAYFMYVEDVDLCWRLGRAGWRIGYEPGGRVAHALGGSSRFVPYRMIAEHHRSLLRFVSKSSEGLRRGLLPVVAAGLAVRTVAAWAHHAMGARST